MSSQSTTTTTSTKKKRRDSSDRADESKKRPKKTPSGSALPPLEYVKLPPKWLMFNGTILYEQSDIDAVLKYMVENLTMGGKPVDVSLCRNFTVVPESWTFLPPPVLAVIARNQIRADFNKAKAGEAFAFATTYGRVPRRKMLKLKN
jgi:hypothetical protein